MLRSFLSVLALVAVVSAAYDPKAINWNCPNINGDSIIRLRPCANSTLALGVCMGQSCGSNPGMATLAYYPYVNDQVSDRAGNAGTQFRIITTGMKPDTPSGYIRLRSEAPGLQTSFLAVVGKDSKFTSNNINGRETILATYTDSDSLNLWKWELRKDGRQCRVLLRNQNTNTRLALFRQQGPTVNGIWKPVTYLGDVADDRAQVDATFEVEFIRNAPATAAAAPAPAPAPARPPAPAPSATTTTTTADKYAAATTTTATPTTTTAAAQSTGKSDQVANTSGLDDDEDLNLTFG